MKLLLVRHGKDKDGFRGGWSTFDLIKEGRNQALKLASYLQKKKLLIALTVLYLVIYIVLCRQQNLLLKNLKYQL